MAPTRKLAAALAQAQSCLNGVTDAKTATDEERRAVVENFLTWWNDTALPLLDPAAAPKPMRQEELSL